MKNLAVDFFSNNIKFSNDLFRTINMIKKKDEELQELIQKIDTLGKKSRDAELK